MNSVTQRRISHIRAVWLGGMRAACCPLPEQPGARCPQVLSTFSQQDIATTVMAYAKLGIHTAELLEALGRRALEAGILQESPQNNDDWCPGAGFGGARGRLELLPWRGG